MESLSKYDKLRFYRDEVKHEFNLLAMRSNILVTCQSFLIVPCAILNTAANFRSVLIPVYLVAALGIFVALVILEPIKAGHRTINKWLLKQRQLMNGTTGLRDLAIDRDLLPGADIDPGKDTDHLRSLAFTRLAPWAFCLFWGLAVVWSTIRAYFRF